MFQQFPDIPEQYFEQQNQIVNEQDQNREVNPADLTETDAEKKPEESSDETTNNEGRPVTATSEEVNSKEEQERRLASK